MIQTIGMIGTGNMGSAILRGVVEAQYIRASMITVFDVSSKRMREISEDIPGIQLASDCAEVAEQSDLIILAGFLSILSEDFTRRHDHRILNIHPSLIPSFCGAGYYGLKVHEAALARGVKVTGATVHFVNEIPDGGEIIAQKAVDIQPGDTAETLQRRVMEQAEWILLPQAAEEVSARILRERAGNEG